jgi:hypothetical protein
MKYKLSINKGNKIYKNKVIIIANNNVVQQNMIINLIIEYFCYKIIKIIILNF